jgi:hypothetical protein
MANKERTMARKKHVNGGDAKKARLIADRATGLAEYAAKALEAAELLRIKSKPVEGLSWKDGERAFLAGLPGLSARIKKKLAKKDTDFTLAQVASVTMVIAEALPEAEPKQQVGLLLITRKLMDCLQKNIVMPVEPARSKRPKSADLVFQFKITLMETQPPVWRRIQIKDCTLDKLHEHIQTAMGWTNSHLHHFKIDDRLYGDPILMEETFEEMEYEDSTTTMLSDILPKNNKRFRFKYEYDFGDSWNHEILFEGCIQAEPSCQYPLCLEGERACPPEDVGGVWGYANFLEALADPKHEQHEEKLEWVGGTFDTEAFDPAATTKAMKKGLPDWRRME